MASWVLRAPCVFCGYNGEGYYQSGRHGATCPWRDVGGLVDRERQLPDVVRAALALAQQALAEWVSRENRLTAFRKAVFAGSCRLPHTKAKAEADALRLLKLKD